MHFSHSQILMLRYYYYYYCCCFMALWILSRTTPVSQYQKGKTKTSVDLLEQETVSGSAISWAICKSAPRPRQITTPLPHHSIFYRPDALSAAKPTVSKHWRLFKALLHSQHNVVLGSPLYEKLASSTKPEVHNVLKQTGNFGNYASSLLPAHVKHLQRTEHYQWHTVTHTHTHTLSTRDQI